VQVTTASGFTYFLEYKISLTDATWMPATQAAGTGGAITLTDTNAVLTQRFYRVRAH
jgi:hypothetical protein